MSLHHLECAALTDLPAARKLVFMALCDSADKVTGLAFPGIDTLKAWSNLGQSQVMAHLSELIDLGYLARVERARPGRRAVFRVFSQIACCDLHLPLEDGSGRPEPSSLPKQPTGPQSRLNGSSESEPFGVFSPGSRTRSRDNGSSEPGPLPVDSHAETANGSENGSENGSDLDRKPSVSPYLLNSSKGVTSPKRAQEKPTPNSSSRQTCQEPPPVPGGNSPKSAARAAEGSLAAVSLRPDRCPGHQNIDIVPPCGGCAAARRQVESQAATTQAAANEREARDAQQRREAKKAARRAAIDACDMCDENGYDGSLPCRHDPDTKERTQRGMALVQAALEKASGKKPPHGETVTSSGSRREKTA